jgi:hypothetical protein
MQSSSILIFTIQGFFFFVLFMGLLMIVHDHGIFVVYVTLFKFFELIPILIDLVNLLFIYQYKIKERNSLNRLYLSLILTFIRLVINLDFIRRKCDCRWKRQLIVIFDLLLFILVNISLLRDSSQNPIRIVRKIILGILIFQLNNLFYNETIWINYNRWSERMRNLSNQIRIFSDRWKIEMEYLYLFITHLILFLRWILPSSIICLFIFFTFQSTVNGKHLSNVSKLHIPIVGMCMTIIYILRWDTLQNQKALKQYGISRFCAGLRIETITAVVETPVEKRSQTCSVCYEEKKLNQFNALVTATCRHVNRTICDHCLLGHVQQAVQITFTDDIHCPELECGIQFDYDTVRDILSLAGDQKLLDRYDQYVTHQQLEKMDEFIWCANPKCNAGQLNAGGRWNYIVTCFACHQKTCFTHRVQWHDGRTCEEYDLKIALDDVLSRRWIVEHSKKCPKCPFQIEKNDGCDHMTCIKCRHEFCWACLADFQPIRQDGNHRHKNTCKHYAPYDGE